MAAKNVLTGWRAGIRTFNASVGGLGGCPYAPGATGNVATEDVVNALTAAGIVTGVDPVKLAHARQLLYPFLSDALRTKPAVDSAACQACEFTRGETCC